MMPLLPTGRQGAPGQPCRQAWLQPSPGTEPSQATEPTLLNGHLKGKEMVELAAGRQGHTHTPGLCFTPFLGGQLPVWVPALGRTLKLAAVFCMGLLALIPKACSYLWVPRVPKAPAFPGGVSLYLASHLQSSVKPNDPLHTCTHRILMQQTPAWHKSKHGSSWQRLHDLAPLLP